MSRNVGAYGAMAYGWRWRSDFPLPAFTPLANNATADITLRRRSGDIPAFVGIPELRSVSRTAMRYESQEMLANVSASGMDIWPGPAWPGQLPPSCFGTAAAGCMTWRGQIAMHGSAVAMGGEAILICGNSGAGKSTLTAALLAHGAQLISDDLSVLSPQRDGRPPRLFTGRRTVRLFPDLAEILASSVELDGSSLPMDDKVVVRPPAADPLQGFPIRVAVILAETGQNPADRFALLHQHLYRPARMQKIPGSGIRMAHLEALARAVPVVQHASVAAYSEDALHKLAKATLEWIDRVA